MSRVWPIEPADGWAPGDRAYCIHGEPATVPALEVGKVYTVKQVVPVGNHISTGLVLEGVDAPPEYCGVWSHRFVKLRPGELPADTVARSTVRSPFKRKDHPHAAS